MKKIGSVLSIILLLAVVALKFVHGQELLIETSVLIMVMFLVMLLFEVFPIMLVCIITLSLMPILKVTETFNGALTGFSNQVVFFIFASFGLAMGLIKTPLPRRILKVMMKKSGDSTPKLVFVSYYYTGCTIFVGYSDTDSDEYCVSIKCAGYACGNVFCCLCRELLLVPY